MNSYFFYRDSVQWAVVKATEGLSGRWSPILTKEISMALTWCLHCFHDDLQQRLRPWHFPHPRWPSFPFKVLTCRASKVKQHKASKPLFKLEYLKWNSTSHNGRLKLQNERLLPHHRFHPRPAIILHAFQCPKRSKSSRCASWYIDGAMDTLKLHRCKTKKATFVFVPVSFLSFHTLRDAASANAKLQWIKGLSKKSLQTSLSLEDFRSFAQLRRN